MTISLVRWYKNGNGWELESLTTEEADTINRALRERNKVIFEECLTDAWKILEKYQTPYNTNLELATEVAQQLFERRAIHISLILDAVLKRKVFELRKNGTHQDLNNE